jgi:hypothetical protein
VSVTVPEEGTIAGALYVTLVVVTLVSVPQAAPVHPVPERAQVTPPFVESYLGIVEKDWLCLTWTEAVDGNGI